MLITITKVTFISIIIYTLEIYNLNLAVLNILITFKTLKLILPYNFIKTILTSTII